MEEEAQHEPSKKITPLQLREEYGLHIANLAQKAMVAPNVVYFMMMGYPITRQAAEDRKSVV